MSAQGSSAQGSSAEGSSAEGSRAQGSSAPHITAASQLGDLQDWGPVTSPIGEASRTAGVVLQRGADGRSEYGVWTCTPGSWHCEVERDEFCYFLAGRATYTHESGEVIEVAADVAAFFAAGWRGRCDVHDTVRKVYAIH